MFFLCVLSLMNESVNDISANEITNDISVSDVVVEWV